MPTGKADFGRHGDLHILVLADMRSPAFIDLVRVDLVQPHCADRHIVHDVVSRPAARRGKPLIQIHRIIPRRHGKDTLIGFQFSLRGILVGRPDTELNDLVLLLRRDHIEQVRTVKMIFRIVQVHLQRGHFCSRPVVNAPDVGPDIIIDIQPNVLRGEAEIAQLRFKTDLVGVQRLETFLTEPAALDAQGPHIDDLETGQDGSVTASSSTHTR